MADRISPIEPIGGLEQIERVQPVGRKESSGQFTAMLKREVERSTQERESFSVAFSKHARTRAEERGIEVTPTLMGQLASSVERASAKGATNILAFDATRAFIINVPNAKVITAISQEEMKENIFTNIDGAVLLK